MRTSIFVCAALLLQACVSPPAAISRDDAGATFQPAPIQPKPPIAPKPPPPNVTRTVLPDGSISITIREPRCPNCQPWEY